MATKEQIKKEFFATLVKGAHGVAVDDVVIPAIVIKDLYKKYQYELSIGEFNYVGDQLEEKEFFRWNEDGLLALTQAGLDHMNHDLKIS